MSRYGHRYSIALFDIDHFKSYNDTLGHMAGDDALRRVASTLANQCRSGDRIYRYGGEELLVVFPEQNVSEAALATERMRGAIEQERIPHPGTSETPFLTISAGVSGGTLGTRFTLEDVIQGADDALYLAKQRGRNQVATFSRFCTAAKTGT